MLLQELKKLKSSELIEFAKVSLFTMNEKQRNKVLSSFALFNWGVTSIFFQTACKKITRYGA
jgi:predicted transcriptional regulator